MPIKVTIKKINQNSSNKKLAGVITNPYQHAPLWESSKAVRPKAKCPHRDGIIQGTKECINCKYNRVRTLDHENKICTCGCVAESWIRRFGEDVNTKEFTIREWSRNVTPKEEGGEQ